MLELEEFFSQYSYIYFGTSLTGKKKNYTLKQENYSSKAQKYWLDLMQPFIEVLSYLNYINPIWKLSFWSGQESTKGLQTIYLNGLDSASFVQCKRGNAGTHIALLAKEW